MLEIILILLRSILAFLLLFLMARIMGKRQLSQLTFFDYCVGITIGSVAATMSVDQNVKIVNGLVSLTIWGLFPLILALLGLKSRGFLRFTDGQPAIIIKNGEILDKNMKKNQLAIDELMLLLRERGVFKVADVELALLETNGQLSVMKKTNKQPVTPKMLGLNPEQEHSPSLVIVDGHILHHNLDIIGYSKEWLLAEIKKQGASKVEDVFLAQTDSKGNVYVDFYQEKVKQNNGKQGPVLKENLKKLHADLEKLTINPSTSKQQIENTRQVINQILPYLK